MEEPEANKKRAEGHGGGLLPRRLNIIENLLQLKTLSALACKLHTSFFLQ